MYFFHHFSVKAVFFFSRTYFRWRIALNERCWYTLGVESQPHYSVTPKLLRLVLVCFALLCKLRTCLSSYPSKTRCSLRFVSYRILPISLHSAQTQPVCFAVVCPLLALLVHSSLSRSMLRLLSLSSVCPEAKLYPTDGSVMLMVSLASFDQTQSSLFVFDRPLQVFTSSHLAFSLSFS
jgi:hypothetical protein